MRETWYYIVAEFKALGLRCVAYGPEFWLAVTAVAGAVVVAAMVRLILWEGEDNDDRR